MKKPELTKIPIAAFSDQAYRVIVDNQQKILDYIDAKFKQVKKIKCSCGRYGDMITYRDMDCPEHGD